MRDGTTIIEATNILTPIARLLHDGVVARAQDVFGRIRDALVFDTKRQKELSAEMHKLAEGYHRYMALEREARAHEQSSNALKALLGSKAFMHAMKTDTTDSIGEETEIFPTVASLRENAPLWQHVQQYLRFVPEAQTGEILEFLDWLEIQTSRQAIESAVRSHPKVFKVNMRGREKYLALK